MKLLNMLKRVILFLKIFALQIRIDGLERARADCIDAETLEHIATTRRFKKRQLEQAQADYSALLPIGVVKTWSAS